MAQRRSVSNHSSSSSMSQAAPATDDGLAELLAPDGYYTYLEIPRESSSSPSDHSSPADPLTAVSIDKDLVKKNYRRLSRKHHPDRPNGSADTFRILHRAHKVLLDDKLRQQYDLLGIDLDEDEHDDNDDHEEDETTNTSNDNQTDNETDAEGKTDKPDGKKKQPKETPTILQELATTVMAAIMQVMVRTALMGCVACLVVRYRLLFYPAVLFMTYIVVRAAPGSWTTNTSEVVSPAVIAIGLGLMHNGRTRDELQAWTLWFWMGEALVLGGFTFNSVSGLLPRTKWIMMALAVFALLMSLWFRGNIWHYLMVIGLEAFAALFVALAFPVFEFMLEAIMNEKLKKVGDKVRAHHAVLEKHYEAKLAQARAQSTGSKK